MTIDQSSPLAAGLVGLFPMQEGTGATTRNVVDGQLAAFSGQSAPKWTSDPSIAFGGGATGNSYLDAGSGLAFDQLPVGKMTIVAKVWMDKCAAGGIAQKGAVESDGFVFSVDSSCALRFRVNTTYGRNFYEDSGTVGSAFGTGKWAQVAVTWDGSTGASAANAHFYVNGVEVGKNYGTSDGHSIGYTRATNLPFYIGNADFQYPGSFNGKMQYLAVYKGRVLTGSEMQQLDEMLPIRMPTPN
jgi:hypothetical protein